MNEMKVTDGFVWKKVTKQAKELYGIFDLFVVDESDTAIESYEALLNWLDKEYDVYIEVGHLPKEEVKKEPEYKWSTLTDLSTDGYLAHFRDYGINLDYSYGG